MSASGKHMNCDEYRTAIAADPSANFEGAGHAAACESCSAFTAEMRALDGRIAAALAIDTPALIVPELPPIEDDNVANLPVSEKRKAPYWLAIAASLALATIVGMQLIGNQGVEYESLEAEILAHIDHEPGALQVTDEAISNQRFTDVVNASVGTLDRNVGLISYANSCVIHGHRVPHLVIQGKRGPVTLILLPDEEIDVARTFTGERVNGVLIPHGGGSIAIVGPREEDLEELEQRVIDSVEWSI
jgi:hypothetical protein